MLDKRDLNALSQLATMMKYAYIKTHFEDMVMSNNGMHQKSLLNELIGMVDFASEQKNEEGLHLINQRIEEFQQEQRNDILDFMTRLEQFFEIRMLKVKSNFWMKCNKPGT